MLIMKYITLYVLTVLSEACGTLGLEQRSLQVYGEEIEGKTILGSVAVEGRHIKMDVLEVWGRR
jgi:hypothetical protein